MQDFENKTTLTSYTESFLHPDNRYLILIAPHGGFIEPGTEVLCKIIAGNLFSYYSFISTLDCGLFGTNHPHHVTSHLFDGPEVDTLVQQHNTACTIHVFRESDLAIHIGGRDLRTSLSLSNSLNSYGFNTTFTNGRNGGMHPDNICNRGLSRQGVQLEISSKLMGMLIKEDVLTEHGESFINILRDFWLAESQLACSDKEI